MWKKLRNIFIYLHTSCSLYVYGSKWIITTQHINRKRQTKRIQNVNTTTHWLPKTMVALEFIVQIGLARINGLHLTGVI